MTVTAYVTRDIGRTFGVTHGPITRSDPIRSDPALLQLHRWSPSHHGVQKVDASDSAPIVAPSPVVSPDAMMNTSAIAHLDFEPEVPCESLATTGEPADYLVELAAWLLQVLPDRRPLWHCCREHYEEMNAVGARHTPHLPPPLRIVQVLR